MNSPAVFAYPNTGDSQDSSQMPSLQLPTVPFANQQSVSNLPSPSQEQPEPSFIPKKANDSVPTPPKVSQLSALEQELAKLHTNRRNTTADATPQQVQSPVTDPSHVKTYSEVLQQETAQAQIQQGTQLPAVEPPRVRKISRFAVSVVKEQQDAAAAAAKQIQMQHQTSIVSEAPPPPIVTPQQVQQPTQTIAAQIAAQMPTQVIPQQQQPQMVVQQTVPQFQQPQVQTQQIQQQPQQLQQQQQQSKPQLNLNLQGLTVQQQIPIQIQQQQQATVIHDTTSLKPLGEFIFLNFDKIC